MSSGFACEVNAPAAPETPTPEIEALRPNENGLLYRHGDPVSLAQALDRIISDPQLAERMSRSAHATVMQQFTLQTNDLRQVVRFAGRAGKGYALFQRRQPLVYLLVPRTSIG